MPELNRTSQPSDNRVLLDGEITVNDMRESFKSINKKGRLNALKPYFNEPEENGPEDDELKTLAGILIISIVLIGAGIGLKAIHENASGSTFKAVINGLLGLLLLFSIYKSATNWTFFKFAFKKFVDAFPSLLMLVIVIGGIVGGFFTATEASAVAVLYALILALIYKEITIKDLPSIILRSVPPARVCFLESCASLMIVCCATTRDIESTVTFIRWLYGGNASWRRIFISDSKKPG